MSRLLFFALYIAIAIHNTLAFADKGTTAPVLVACDSHKTKSYWANLLGWVSNPIATNLCKGYYSEPDLISAYPLPSAIGQTEITITSSGQAAFSENSASTLEGNVKLVQPGREINAQKISVYRDQETGRVKGIELQDDVRFQEHGKLILGKHAYLDLVKESASISEGAYHITRPSQNGPNDAWGTLGKAYRAPSGVLSLEDATYTTCNPTDPAWHLQAKHIELDKESGRGFAKNAWFYAGDFPFLYTPYMTFPIDKRRYSGFLNPSFGYDNDSGAVINIPYYFNLAPNYDDTFTLSPITHRGLFLTNMFRYLTHRSNGFFQMGFLPKDQAFANFRASAPQQYPLNFNNAPFLAQLQNDTNSRWDVAFHNGAIFNENWSTSLDFNYATDAYYFQNLGNSLEGINTNQLLSEADLNYQNEHWTFLGRLQSFQTLHQINQDFAMDQYRRLPQMDLSATYPNQAYGLDYELNSEWVLFGHNTDFFTSIPYPTGNRGHFAPQISRPFSTPSGFLIPTLALDSTGYSINNNGVVDMSISPTLIIPDPIPQLNLVRTLPIFDIDSGIYLDRGFHFGNHEYRQTLEPRAYYLYVPQKNQNNIPVFDTTQPPFDFDELFRPNRFIGYDRLGDANQLALGLTTRLLNGYTGESKAEASIGGAYYFHRHSVCLYPNCSDDPTIGDQISPIATQLTYHLNNNFSLLGNAAWDPDHGAMNNAGVHTQYLGDNHRIFNVGYDFVQNGDVINANNPNTQQNNLERLDLSLSWPIGSHWSVVGNWDYNLSHEHAEAYLYGLEYNTCCWAVRLIASRTLQAEDMYGVTAYRSDYYVQFLLKGLGVVENNGASDLLAHSIPGYRDTFKN